MSQLELDSDGTGSACVLDELDSADRPDFKSVVQKQILEIHICII